MALLLLAIVSGVLLHAYLAMMRAGRATAWIRDTTLLKERIATRLRLGNDIEDILGLDTGRYRIAVAPVMDRGEKNGRWLRWEVKPAGESGPATVFFLFQGDRGVPPGNGAPPRGR